MIDTIIFDLGGVLIDWQPRTIYKNYFYSKKELNYFFDHICTMEWNEKQDEGRTIKEATDCKIAEFPAYEEPIRMYYDQWKETIKGPIDETVDILEELHANAHYKLLALTNWSAETFSYPLEKFHFLSYFQGIVVSGEEKVKKPDSRIYHILLDRFGVEPQKSIFIDDNEKNVQAANQLGIHGILFESPSKLTEELNLLSIF